MNKKGVSHVEVILAFLLFIFAVFFILTLFPPWQAAVPQDNSKINQLLLKFQQNASTELSEMGIQMNNAGNQLNNVNNLAFFIPLSQENLNSRIADIDGSIFDSYPQQNGSGYEICAQAQNGNWPYFFYIRTSQRIAQSSLDSSACPPSVNEAYYTITSTEQRKVLSEKGILDLNDSYYGNYSALKSYLGVSGQDNFDFMINFSDGKIIEGKTEIPQNLNVNSINKRMEVLRLDGETGFADVNIRIW